MGKVSHSGSADRVLSLDIATARVSESQSAWRIYDSPTHLGSCPSRECGPINRTDMVVGDSHSVG